MSIGLNNPVIRGFSIPFRFFAGHGGGYLGIGVRPGLRHPGSCSSVLRKATERLR